MKILGVSITDELHVINLMFALTQGHISQEAKTLITFQTTRLASLNE